jgi:hypothetical protein
VHTDIYDGFAPLLKERGFFPLPIGPGTKAPHRFMPSKKEFVLFVGWQERPARLTTPQPNAGIGVRLGAGIVGLDYDNEDAALRVSEAIGGSLVNKAGATAWTEFYRASFSVPSENFVNDDGELMLQVLSDGRQTVIPPSVHPDTGKPYRWTNGRSLYDTSLNELPELPADYRERIIALGYKVGGKKKASTASTVHESHTTYDQDSPHADLNQLALKNLSRWVPDLNLYRCKRRRGPHASYEAVATWRPSTHGRKKEDRDLNLKISPLGIKDFGTDVGYSPLDLVMVARGCSLFDAMTWLEERVRPDRGPEVNFEALAGEPKTEVPPEGGTEEQTRDKKVLVDAGAWFHGNDLPPGVECSFEGVLPVRGAGLIVAQYGCNKSHILTDLCVAATMPDGPDGPPKWAGRRRIRRIGAVYMEFENSDVPMRIACACKKRGVTERLPLIAFHEAPPIVMRKRVNPVAIKWYRDVLSAANRELMRTFGVPLGLIGIDPLVDAADFDNENDNSEANRAMKAFDVLGNEFNCIVAVNDHAGKEIGRGPRGGSSKPGKAHFVFTLPEKIADRAQHRLMTVKKLRGMPDGWAVDHWFELIEVEVAGGNTGTNLAVCWGHEVARGEEDAPGDDEAARLSKMELRGLRVLEVMTKAASLIPSTHVRWVSIEAWWEELCNQHIIDPDAHRDDRRKAFRRIVDGLRDKGHIKVHMEKVCIPL